MSTTMPAKILGLRLFTNRGRFLIARALKSTPGEKGIVVKDGVTYENVNVAYFDVPFNSGTLKGFFGRSTTGANGKILRLGIIWGSMPATTAEESSAEFADSVETVDSEDFALMQNDQEAGNKFRADATRALNDVKQKLSAALEVCDLCASILKLSAPFSANYTSSGL